MTQNKFDSVCLVTVSSNDTDNSSSASDEYGTGFFVYQDDSATYVVTCAHVVQDAYIDYENHKILLDGQYQADIAAYDADADICVLQAKIPNAVASLRLSNSAREGQEIRVIGMSAFSGKREKRDVLSLNGFLAKEAAWSFPGKARIPTWHLKLSEDDFKLKPGYSGSPVLSKDSSDVIGIVSHRVHSGYSGIAVSAQILKSVWAGCPQAIFLNISATAYKSEEESKNNIVGLSYYEKGIKRKEEELNEYAEKRAIFEKARLTEASVKAQIDLDNQIKECKKKEQELLQELIELQHLSRGL